MTVITDAVTDGETRAIKRRYFLTMASVCAVDLTMVAIFVLIAGAYEVALRNIATSLALFLAVNLLNARRLFAPIARSLDSGRNFDAIQRNLTQLPLRSAAGVGMLALPLMSFRIGLPFLLPEGASALPLPTILDAVATVFVLVAFFFVFTYFAVSDYLAQLCTFIFKRHGQNLQLYFGSFATKLAVALMMVSILPLLLVAIDANSYDFERARSEVTVDVISALFGIAVAAYYISRSLIRPLGILAEGMEKVTAGDLGVRVPVTSNDEMGNVTIQFNRMIGGLQEREFIRETLGKYVSEHVATQILKDRGRLAGEVRAATLLFIDIQGFTSLAERLEPQQVIGLLNEFTDLVLDPIRQHGGVVNNFIGDGIFASFNLPLACDNHARSAVLAALDINRSVSGRIFAGDIRIAVRMGINSGSVVAGTVGSAERVTYSILGDAVNVAHRVEQLNKELGTTILVTDATRQLAGEGLPLSRVGDLPVRGRTEPVALYQVVLK